MCHHTIWNSNETTPTRRASCQSAHAACKTEVQKQAQKNECLKMQPLQEKGLQGETQPHNVAKCHRGCALTCVRTRAPIKDGRATGGKKT